MKITKDNVKIGQNLYDATTGEVYEIVYIDKKDDFQPVRVQRSDGQDGWVCSNGYARGFRVQLVTEQNKG